MSKHTYIRGKHNSIAPFHQWHRVKEWDGTIVITACSLALPSAYGIYDLSYVERNGGDKCATIACGMGE